MDTFGSPLISSAVTDNNNEPIVASDECPITRPASTAAIELDSVLASEMAPQRLFVESGVTTEIANLVPNPFVDRLHVRLQCLENKG